LSLASCWVFLVGNAQVHQGFFTWTPFKSSKCNALWLICMYSYLRNTSPFLLWTFFFPKFWSLLQAFMAFSLSLTRATTYDIDLWEGMILDDIGIPHCLKTFVSKIIIFSWLWKKMVFIGSKVRKFLHTPALFAHLWSLSIILCILGVKLLF